MRVPLAVICAACPYAYTIAGEQRCHRTRQPTAGHQAAVECPIGRFGTKPVADAPQSGGSRLAALWREWHERAARPVTDHAAEQAYIDDLARRTGCAACIDHWPAARVAVPIDTSTPASYTRGTYAIHQHVNDSLNVDGITFREAVARYAGWLAIHPVANAN